MPFWWVIAIDIVHGRQRDRTSINTSKNAHPDVRLEALLKLRGERHRPVAQVFGKARRRESIQSEDASPMATISDGYDQLRRARPPCKSD